MALPHPLGRPQNMKSETYSSRPFIWFTTWLLLKNFKFFALDDLTLPPRKGPKYEIRNLLVKTFHLIYYMTSILKVWILTFSLIKQLF
jgi:hypothetical protein